MKTNVQSSVLFLLLLTVQLVSQHVLASRIAFSIRYNKNKNKNVNKMETNHHQTEDELSMLKNDDADDLDALSKRVQHKRQVGYDVSRLFNKNTNRNQTSTNTTTTTTAAAAAGRVRNDDENSDLNVDFPTTEAYETTTESNEETYLLPASSDNVLTEKKINQDLVCSEPGFYADVNNNCQIFHYCVSQPKPDGTFVLRQYSFFCGNQTIFDQYTLTCQVPSKAVPCSHAPEFYPINRRTAQGKKEVWLHKDEDQSVVKKYYDESNYRVNTRNSHKDESGLGGDFQV